MVHFKPELAEKTKRIFTKKKKKTEIEFEK